MDCKQTLEEYRAEFESVLAEYLQSMQVRPPVLAESVRYSLTLGGKRLRPVLMFACAKIFGGKPSDVAGFALALEMIHTYSLIHDDLPAMDDDDFRRGKPSNHKVFGEGQAILAGDALLNEAYSICFAECRKGRTYLNAAAELCRNAGMYGMVAGQSADLFYEGKEAGRKEEEFIVLNKTAKMIISAVTVPAYVYDADENIIGLLHEFGKNLGFLFQITDDMLDVSGEFGKLGKTVGKDAQEDKLSAVKVYGMEKCAELADSYSETCLKILDQLPFDCEFLAELVKVIRTREH
ncbi:MAG TPA: polyprenyl synthetase family protein [Candidatus Borkfalkia excrementigallinarum]|uniref:Farnesyl diphosphate synthase n=1 Tax=Candidatus Borkfalkia excrementigallinarum TaxID=2838506 RepID=A0A9D2CSY8_9FIRM|nr:polyprenyl synthetase family protein [Candidatus Borkfalkia excrementigallinarum]